MRNLDANTCLLVSIFARKFSCINPTNAYLSWFLLRAGDSVLGAKFTDAGKRDASAFAGFALMQAAFHTVKRIDRIPPWASLQVNGVETSTQIGRALCVGLGAGAVPTFGRKLGWAVDVVEIRDAVVDIAASHFDFETCEHRSDGLVSRSLTSRNATCESRVGCTARYDKLTHH